MILFNPSGAGDRSGACPPRVSPVVMEIKPLRGLGKAFEGSYAQVSIMVGCIMAI